MPINQKRYSENPKIRPKRRSKLVNFEVKKLAKDLIQIGWDNHKKELIVNWKNHINS